MSQKIDPVAEKSSFLQMYMSNHPDTLVAYAKWYGNVQEIITSAEMTAIDSKGMTLKCALKKGGKKVVYIPIKPPLRGYEEVKPRLLEMKGLAQEGLGMIKAPQITTFYFPLSALTSACMSIALVSCLYAPPNHPSPLFGVVDFVQQTAGLTRLQQYAYVGIGLRVLECLHTIRLCCRHRTGFGLGVLYLISTFLCGFPIWVNLRKKIQALRIESVMKVE